MMELKSITQNNNNNQQQQISNNDSLSFHDRAALVIKDILTQIGFDDDKLRMISGVVSAINMFPPIGPLQQAKIITKDIEPILLQLIDHNDPSIYINAIPEEKMIYFINQVITRLEWVKNGNNEKGNNNQEQQNNNETTTTNNNENS